MAKEDTRRPGQVIGDLYRQTAGLPERKSDAPLTNDDNGSGALDIATEPEGGYGGKDGITNTGAISATEDRLHRDVTEARVPEADESHALDAENHHLPESEKPTTAPQVRDAAVDGDDGHALSSSSHHLAENDKPTTTPQGKGEKPKARS